MVLGLAARAPLTILDETYLGMDAAARATFYRELLADYLEHPRTVILSTHLIEEVAGLFEQVVIIDRGRLVAARGRRRAARPRASRSPARPRRSRAFVAGRTVLGEQQLGGVRSATLYGTLDDGERVRAESAGLALGPVGLQDLFIHLTGDANHARVSEAAR